MASLKLKHRQTWDQSDEAVSTQILGLQGGGGKGGKKVIFWWHVFSSCHLVFQPNNKKAKGDFLFPAGDKKVKSVRRSQKREKVEVASIMKEQKKRDT
jgi:hypothetical protein